MESLVADCNDQISRTWELILLERGAECAAQSRDGSPRCSNSVFTDWYSEAIRSRAASSSHRPFYTEEGDIVTDLKTKRALGLLPCFSRQRLGRHKILSATHCKASPFFAILLFSWQGLFFQRLIIYHSSKPHHFAGGTQNQDIFIVRLRVQCLARNILEKRNYAASRGKRAGEKPNRRNVMRCKVQ